MTDNPAHRLKLRIVEAYDAAVKSGDPLAFRYFHALVGADEQPLPHWSAVSREG